MNDDTPGRAHDDGGGERERVATLDALRLHEAPRDGALDALVRLAARHLGGVAAMVNFIDATRLWSQAHTQARPVDVPREIAFCSRTIESDALLEVRDMRADPRWCDNPAVRDAPHIRFYAGVAVGVDSQRLGALCVTDIVPRRLTPMQRATLQDLALATSHWLAARRDLLALQRQLPGAATSPAPQPAAGMIVRHATEIDFDPSALADAVGADPKALADVRRTFLASLARARQEIDAAIAQQRWADAGLAANRLKCSSRLVGAQRLSQLFDGIEQAGRRGDDGDLRRLSRALPPAMDALRGCMG